MSALLQGLLLGVSIAVPVGPIGLLCLRRSLTAGRRAGLVSGLGAATADALYGLIVALGLNAITHQLLAYQRPLQLAGGLFILYLGTKILRSYPPSAASPTEPASTLAAAYVSTFALTLANPMTILSFLGLFAGAGIVSSDRTSLAAFLLVLGVFLGSTAWWITLSFTAAALSTRLPHGGLRLLNLLSGTFIAAFGVYQLYRLL